MKKVLVSLATAFLLANGAYAQDEMRNDGRGFYLGAGLGVSSYQVTYLDDSYNLYDSDDNYVVEADSLDDSDMGYLFYAGYQFNKIIGIEASYTDYGRFEYRKSYREPKAAALYANAGYSFFDGQLRPFGNLGFGYLWQKQSERYYDFDDAFATLHTGLGVEYYPSVLKGLGFRAAYESDFHVERVRSVDEDTDEVTRESLWQDYTLFYFGLQYKFRP